MALIKCPECKNNISDQAENCPKCGYQLKKQNIKEEIKDNFNSSKLKNFKFDYKSIVIIALLIVGAYFIFNQDKQNPSGGTSTPSSTSGYSIFNSSNMGISFEYPSSYKVATDNDGYIYVGKNTNNNNVVIPYVIIGRYDNFNDQVTFLNSFTNYMKKEYSDLVITIDLLSGNIGNKLVYGLAYNYTSNGHLIVDNRYAVTINNKVYMIGSKEENTNSTEINSVVEHIINTLTEGGN